MCRRTLFKVRLISTACSTVSNRRSAALSTFLASTAPLGSSQIGGTFKTLSLQGAALAQPVQKVQANQGANDGVTD